MSNVGHCVSIGVPVYNGARFLPRTLDSLLGQTYRNLEVVISDNASTDATEEICRRYAAGDSRVRYVRNTENHGAAWNLNRVVELATGEYFKWAMADDVCLPELVERCVEVLDANPDVVLACARTLFIDEDDKPIRRLDPCWDLRSEKAHERLRRVIFLGGHWVNADALQGVMRTKALLRTRLVPRYQGGDKRPIAELSLQGKFVEIPEFLFARRQHAGTSGRHNPEYAKDRGQAIEWMTEFFKGSKAEVTRPTWNLYRDHFGIVASAALPIRRKFGLMLDVLRAMRWNWNILVRELRP